MSRCVRSRVPIARACRRSRETELEHAIAQSLSDAADEEYRVRVTDKNYGPSTAPLGAMRLTLMVGRV